MTTARDPRAPGREWPEIPGPETHDSDTSPVLSWERWAHSSGRTGLLSKRLSEQEWNEFKDGQMVITSSLEVGLKEALCMHFRQKETCSEPDWKLQAEVLRDAEWHSQSLWYTQYWLP